MNTTSISISEAATRTFEGGFRHFTDMTDKTQIVRYEFETPGVKKSQVYVTFDSLEGILKVDAYNHNKGFDFKKDVFETINEHPRLKRWNGEANLLPLRLVDGILTVEIECGILNVQRGVFEE